MSAAQRLGIKLPSLKLENDEDYKLGWDKGMKEIRDVSFEHPISNFTEKMSYCKYIVEECKKILLNRNSLVNTNHVTGMIEAANYYLLYGRIVFFDEKRFNNKGEIPF